MNRLAPLAARKIPQSSLDLRGRWENLPETNKDPPEDLKLFATGWLGGLVFFGTYLS